MHKVAMPGFDMVSGVTLKKKKKRTGQGRAGQVGIGSCSENASQGGEKRKEIESLSLRTFLFFYFLPLHHTLI